MTRVEFQNRPVRQPQALSLARHCGEGRAIFALAFRPWLSFKGVEAARKHESAREKLRVLRHCCPPPFSPMSVNAALTLENP